MKREAIFKGAGVALVTPMKWDGSVNFRMLKELIEFQVANNTQAIIICGTTGENATLTDEEHINVMRFTIDQVNGRIPVIAGTGSNDTAHAIFLSKVAQDIGADAVLLVTPYYNKTTQAGLIRHFGMISDAIDIPIVLYNVPSRTGMSMEISTIKELAKRENINSIKEASGNMSFAANLMAECGDDIYLYSGNDDIIVPILSIGGIGVISVLSNILPLDTNKMVTDYLHGYAPSAMQLQLQYEKLIKALFCEVNPIPVKEALRIMGFEVGYCRPPLDKMSPKHRQFLKKCMSEIHLI